MCMWYLLLRVKLNVDVGRIGIYLQALLHRMLHRGVEEKAGRGWTIAIVVVR